MDMQTSYRPRRNCNGYSAGYYKKLTDFPAFDARSGTKKTIKWNPNAAFDIEVLEEDEHRALVHYVGWGNEWDQWIEKESVISKEEFPEDDRSPVNIKASLRLAIKEKLTISVNNNPECIIRMPITPEVYAEIFGTSDKKSSLSVQELDEILGSSWSTRILNKNGDFAYVRPNGIRVHITKAQPLIEYIDSNGKLEEHHMERGHNFTLRFIRSYGTRQEFVQRQ